MARLTLLMSLGALLGGALAIVQVMVQSRRAATRVRAYLREVEAEDAPPDEFRRKLAQPFAQRVLTSARAQVADRLGGLLPHQYVENLRQKLALAGMSGPGRAERVVAGQIALTVATVLVSAVFVFHVHPPVRYAVLVGLGLPLVGVLLPVARIDRKVSERQQAILTDLPDTLDLLAISVEAGVGFEGALAIVTQHFNSPLADEFSLTLREMELGATRQEAFQNLKKRTDVPALSNFILALLQGDALGIPVGRILKTQAADMRSQRRMWAREKAAKLPVKMLFPMIMFIFPPVFVVVMGPAAGSIAHGFG